MSPDRQHVRASTILYILFHSRFTVNEQKENFRVQDADGDGLLTLDELKAHGPIRERSCKILQKPPNVVFREMLSSGGDLDTGDGGTYIEYMRVVQEYK